MIVTINEKEITVPQSWNELSHRQLYDCYAILMTDTKLLFEAHELLPSKRILLMMRLLDIDDQFVKRWQADCIQAEGKEEGPQTFLDELQELCQVSGFLFHQVESEEEDKALFYEINLGLTQCPYPTLKVNKKPAKKTSKNKVWFAPSDGLANLTIYELGVTFTLFENFIKSQEEQFAEKLLATLYRPAKGKTKKNKQSGYGGDIRQPYLHHESMVAGRLPKIKALPKPTKQLLIFWFACCRQQIIENYPNVFTSTTADKSNKANDYGWGAVLLNLAQGLVHLDQVAQQKYSNALAYLSYLEDQRKLRELNRP